MTKTIEHFSDLPLFSEMNKNEIEIIKKYTDISSFQKGDTITTGKEKKLYIILEGKITGISFIFDKFEKKYIEYNSGDVFGEMSYFNLKTEEDEFIVLESGSVLVIKEKDLLNLIGNHSETAIKLVSRIISLTIKKLRESSNFLADIVQWGENASRRVITDELTGIYNRAFLEDAIENFFNISKSNSKPLSLLMLDIDNFRTINETLGHETGNAILTEIVNLIKDIISKYGIIARYGGDEFSILLPETGLKKALDIAEQLRNAVNSHNFYKNKSIHSIPTAISIGISSFPETALDLDTFKEKADSALYKAKNSGRNRAEFIE